MYEKKKRTNESMNALTNELAINYLSTLERVSLKENVLLFVVKRSNILAFAV